MQKMVELSSFKRAWAKLLYPNEQCGIRFRILFFTLAGAPGALVESRTLVRYNIVCVMLLTTKHHHRLKANRTSNRGPVADAGQVFYDHMEDVGTVSHALERLHQDPRASPPCRTASSCLSAPQRTRRRKK